MLPSAEETLLLRACLWEGDAARESWDSWRAGLADPTDTFRGERARLRGLGPLLDAALRRQQADAGSREMATALRAAGAREELRAAALRQTLAAWLEEAPDPVVVKGALLAEAVYPDPALRHTHDLDLLAASNGAPAQETTPSGVAVNRHRHLFRRRDHRVAEPAMRSRLAPAEVAGVTVRTLAPDDALVHVCAHAYSLGARDIAHWAPDTWFLLQRTPDLDWERVRHTTERGHLAVPLATLLRYLGEELAAPVPADVLAQLDRRSQTPGARLAMIRWRGRAVLGRARRRLRGR